MFLFVRSSRALIAVKVPPYTIDLHLILSSEMMTQDPVSRRTTEINARRGRRGRVRARVCVHVSTERFNQRNVKTTKDEEKSLLNKHGNKTEAFHPNPSLNRSMRRREDLRRAGRTCAPRADDGAFRKCFCSPRSCTNTKHTQGAFDFARARAIEKQNIAVAIADNN